VALLEYVRYDFQPKIQQSSIKIMSILRHLNTFSFSYFQFIIFCVLLLSWISLLYLYFVFFLSDSSRMVGLVQLLLKCNASNSLIEDYAACLELRSQEFQNLDNSSDDPGILIMQVCLHYYKLFVSTFLVYNLPKMVFVCICLLYVSASNWQYQPASSKYHSFAP